MTNRLAHETSPYLLQHADNPVDWYPWGEEALRKAKTEDKPIFLSVGYSACHWCHVMAHESFEDETVAAILNDNFVNIKVDREERPDLDRIYMSAVQSLTGRGGWPMSVFLTPEGQPFFGGTYFPPSPRYGMASFTQVLHGVADAWKNKRQEILESGEKISQALKGQSVTGHDQGELNPETLEEAVKVLRENYDPKLGGWGAAPKFPHPMTIEFLLRQHHKTGDEQALKMAAHTLETMARGGIYDQVGGGFHRYSVDERWLVPHFEKMLYDNAQLARVYLHAWQVTGDDFFRTITKEILDYVTREMRDPSGGFYATQDADSEGEEGKFFVWTPAELRNILGEEADAFMAAYGVTESGNFEGKNILEFLGVLDHRSQFAAARQQLLTAREERIPPNRDEKVITSWNGLMLAAFAEGARVFNDESYREVAITNADFLLNQLRYAEGRLWHIWKDEEAKINGYLEDYVYLIEGLLALYQTTFEARWYQAAQEVADAVLAHFSDPEGGFFDTSDDHEKLIMRPKSLQDSAVPSGNGMAAYTLARLSGLALETTYLERTRESLASMQGMLASHPLGFSQWLQALDYVLAPPREIAIIGNQEKEDTRRMLQIIFEGYRPHQVVALGSPQPEPVGVPLLEDRAQVAGAATVYVCTNFTCRRPITDTDELREVL